MSRKYRPLFNQDGKEKTVPLLPGHLCECQASKHSLINNCASCGRVVCSQEGSGPCFFCGDLVSQLIIFDSTEFLNLFL